MRIIIINQSNFIQIKFNFSVNWRQHLRPILVIFASTVVITICVSSDITLLGVMENDYTVGIYTVVVKLCHIVQGVLAAILTVVIPRLAWLWGKKRCLEYNSLLKQLFNGLLLLALPIVTGITMLSRAIILLIAGQKYLAALGSLRIISWAILFSIMEWLFSDCVLIVVKRETLILRNTVMVALLNVGLNLVLIPLLSDQGAAISTVIAELSAMLLNYWTCRDIVNLIILNKDTCKNIFEVLVGCMGIVIVCGLCERFSNIFIQIVLAVSISGLVYVSILLLLRN